MNNCPNCGLVRGFHNSILQGCTCQWQMASHSLRLLCDEVGALRDEIAVAVAAEREACAKLCDEVGNQDANTHAWDAAAAIRARGEKDAS
jgi:hypothetical protein